MMMSFQTGAIIYGTITVIALWAAAYYEGRYYDSIGDEDRGLSYMAALFWPMALTICIVVGFFGWPFRLAMWHNSKEKAKVLTDEEIQLLKQEDIE